MFRPHLNFLLFFSIVLYSCASRPFFNKKYHCVFDKANLAITGDNIFDTILNIKYSVPNTVEYIEMGGFQPICRYIYHDNKQGRLLSRHLLNVSSIGCKDTIWAKKQLLDELKARYPYKMIDSFIVAKNYEVYLVDSTKLLPSEYMIPDFSASSDFYKPLESYIFSLGLLYDSIGYKFEPYITDTLFNIKMMDHRKGRYDVKVNYEFYNLLGEDAHFKMIRDSTGFDVRFIRKEIVPYKTFKFL